MINIDVLEKIEEAHQSGKKIGLVQGSWDVFHEGHLSYLIEAKKLCDFLVVGMDSDAKIQKRKGISRPIFPESGRYRILELLMQVKVLDAIVIKQVAEPKWGLIKELKPDVLIAIKENYRDSDIEELEKICGKVEILPRQSENSTSDYIRKMIIAESKEKLCSFNNKVTEAIEKMKQRLGLKEEMVEPLSLLFQSLKHSTDSSVPVAVGCFLNDKWYFGTNQIDLRISKYDIENRTELFYSTVEHAEINMLKKLGEVEKLNVPIWTTLFPCDKCMKTFIDKGVKEIFYLEDHPDKNWSKRSHALADKFGIKTTKIIELPQIVGAVSNCEDETLSQQVDSLQYRYIDPKNVRHQEQLDIMLEKESKNLDPLDPSVIDQEILFETDFWYISENRFPYEEINHQFLIASKYPIYGLNDMSKNMWDDLFEVWKRLTEEYNIPGGALCYRFGNTLFSGASLTRLHAHLITPKEGKKAKFTIGGNKEFKKGIVFRKKRVD